MRETFDLIAFDADDTLWHNLDLFTRTEERFAQMLSAYHDPQWIAQRLIETERRNLEIFGYGVKGYTLSMIETAVELSEGRVTGKEIERILEFGKAMLKAPIDLLPHVEETVRALYRRIPLMIITKGDLFDQEAKIARSGLADFFEHVEIVSEKEPETYRRILKRYSIVPERFLMVGNSLKSDVLPVLSLGGRAVHVPYHDTWVNELADEKKVRDADYDELDHLGQLVEWLESRTAQRA
ncbi:MAG TPA: HAD family hydrolase [Acidobacteriota bacterium]|nr:HAD family hydrolase [Acidobacteriota bacterium]